MHHVFGFHPGPPGQDRVGQPDGHGPDDAGIVGDLTALYYKQRATAGMIVTEGVFPTADGKGYLRSPDIDTQSKIAGWKAEAVHGAGGRIVM